MQQHLGRQDGVEKVEVSLEKGEVVIYPKADGRVEPAAILKATYDSGVTVAEMTLTASGQLVRDPQKGLVFRVMASQSFEVAPNELAQSLEKTALGAPLTLRGRLYQKPPGKQKPKASEPLRLEILEVMKKP